MAKLTQDQVAIAIQEGKEANKPLTNRNHPYYGLKDGKGWLTRYRVESCKISRNWMQAFLEAGGSCDIKGVYGISPYNESIEKASPVLVGRLNAQYRMDSFEHSLMTCISEGVEVSDDITIDNFHRLYRGIERKKELQYYGVETKFSYMRLGWMNEYDWYRFILKNAAIFPTENYRREGIVMAIEKCEKYGQPYTLGKVAQKLNNDREKYLKRLSYYRESKAIRFGGYSTIVEAWVARKVIQSGYYVLSTKGNRIANLIYVYGSQKESSYTSMNYVDFWSNSKLLTNHRNNVVTTTRNINEYTVGKILDTVFVWETEKGFPNHVEAKTVKEGISKLLARKPITGNVISLLQVRMNKHFCLAGTRNYLQTTLPHIATILKSYNSWDEVPTDIMEYRWELNENSKAVKQTLQRLK